MICPKCKKEIDDNSITCEHCNAKVKIVCPECGEINSLGTENCVRCKLPFIKYCPICHCANLPNFPTCRKCHSPLTEDSEIAIAETEEVPVSEQEEQEEIIELINDSPSEQEMAAQEELSDSNDDAPASLEDLQEILAQSDEEEPNIQGTEEEEEKVETEKVEDISDSSTFESSNQDIIKTKIVDAIRENAKYIISVSAQEGAGKSLLLKYAFNELTHQRYIWLFAECSAATQISPLGLWQELLLNYINMPNMCNDVASFKKANRKSIEIHFGKLSNEDYDVLFNILYPTNTARFEDILSYKKVIFDLIERLMKILCAKNKVIIVVDDFDMIDGISYELLINLIDKKVIGEQLNLIIAYKENKISQGYFHSNLLEENAYLNIFIKPMEQEEMDAMIKTLLNGFEPLPKYIKGQIYNNSKGISAYIEQTIIFLNEINAFYIENGEIKFKDEFRQFVLPTTVSDIIKSRLELVHTGYPLVYQTLCASALLGNKFTKILLQKTMQIDETSINNVMQFLVASTYITPFADGYTFKNTLIWRNVYEEAKFDKNYLNINEKLFNVLSEFTLSNNTLRALLAQNINQKMSAFSIWTENIKLAAAVGDVSLYVISQKQSLKLVREIDLSNSSLISNNICERIGKLIYRSQPSEALDYLTEAIMYSKRLNNVLKLIELTGYAIYSSNKIGNFFATIELVDNALNMLEGEEYELERALIKSKKLSSLLSIGNCEDIVNLSDNEIIPVLEDALSKNIATKNISDYGIYEVWLDTNIILANALAIQGNNRCYETLNTVSEVIQENEAQNLYYTGRRKLTLALANTIKGDINTSEDILQELAREAANDRFEMGVISQWNLIHVLNRIFKHDWTNLKEELFSLATFANNCDDSFTKNMLKTLLAKLIKEDGNVSKAIEIYNEEIAYFAKEKIALGALLCWYFIAEAFLTTKGPTNALDIAQKALEVAKNPRINNTYFVIYFKHLIAEIYIIKGELQSAKMYLEKALILARKYDLPLLQVKLYHLYGRYLEEVTSKHRDNKSHHAQSAMKMYEKAALICEKYDLKVMLDDINTCRHALKTYCQLNKIQI